MGQNTKVIHTQFCKDKKTLYIANVKSAAPNVAEDKTGLLVFQNRIFQKIFSLVRAIVSHIPAKSLQFQANFRMQIMF